MTALVLLDLDGTLYEAGTPVPGAAEAAPVPGAAEAVRQLRAAGHTLRFFTNTDSQSTGALLERGRGMGFDVRQGELFTPVVGPRLDTGDDRSTDIAMAVRAGLRSVQPRTGKHDDQASRSNLPAPEYVIGSVAELPGLL